MGFHFRIEYRTSKTNWVADALSRAPEIGAVEQREESELRTMKSESRPVFAILDDLPIENKSLPDLIRLVHQINEGKMHRGFKLQNGLILFKGRYYLSPNFALIPQLLDEAHSSPVGGHVGVKRTLVRLLASFFWTRMRRSVEEFVATCLTCQQIKYSTLPLAGLL